MLITPTEKVIEQIQEQHDYVQSFYAQYGIQSKDGNDAHHHRGTLLSLYKSAQEHTKDLARVLNENSIQAWDLSKQLAIERAVADDYAKKIQEMALEINRLKKEHDEFLQGIGFEPNVKPIGK